MGSMVIHDVAVDRETIARTYGVIRPHIRRTPVVEVDAADFGLTGKMWLKLELLQHAGSFKPSTVRVAKAGSDESSDPAEQPARSTSPASASRPSRTVPRPISAP